MIQTSARNQFPGTVRGVSHGPVDAEIDIDLGNGLSMVSVITRGSVDRLGLVPGKTVVALVKASSVLLCGVEQGPSSARNRLCGTISACTHGAVNGEVSLTLPGGTTVTAIVTNDSIRTLALATGRSACALIKASNVLIAVPA